jgi:hypothetical protein
MPQCRILSWYSAGKTCKSSVRSATGRVLSALHDYERSFFALATRNVGPHPKHRPLPYLSAQTYKLIALIALMCLVLAITHSYSFVVANS